jgi:hypothetical protein
MRRLGKEVYIEMAPTLPISRDRYHTCIPLKFAQVNVCVVRVRAFMRTHIRIPSFLHGSEGLSRLAACRCATLRRHVRIVETVRIIQRRIGVGKETSDPGPIGGVFGQFEA